MTRLKLTSKRHDSMERPAPELCTAWIERYEGPKLASFFVVHMKYGRTERAARRKVLREYRRILERDLEQVNEMEREEG